MTNGEMPRIAFRKREFQGGFTMQDVECEGCSRCVADVAGFPSDMCMRTCASFWFLIPRF